MPGMRMSISSGFGAVAGLADHGIAANVVEQFAQTIAREFFVIYD
jgi:hypothetical protein